MSLDLALALKDLIEMRGESLATAESCTGGRIGQLVTGISGASAIYMGGVISYSNTSKERILKVPHRILARYGAVSEPTAFYMAQNAKKLFGSTWSLSVTGISGPLGGSAEKPVGFTCFGWSGPKGTVTRQVSFAPASRKVLQEQAVNYSLKNLLKIIKSET